MIQPFSWKKEYEIDVQLINNDHIGLLAMSHSISSVFRDFSEEALPILFDYLDMHYKIEEYVMKILGTYDEEHVKDHQSEFKELNDMAKNHNSLELITARLITHITSHDKNLKDPEKRFTFSEFIPLDGREKSDNLIHTLPLYSLGNTREFVQCEGLSFNDYPIKRITFSWADLINK